MAEIYILDFSDRRFVTAFNDDYPDRITVPTIKGGFPNRLTAFVEIRRLKTIEAKRAAAAGESSRPLHYCAYCGQRWRSYNALVGHLKHCEARRRYIAGITDGLCYTIAGWRCTMITDREKVIWKAAEIETRLNELIAAGEYDETNALNGFVLFIRGAQSARADGCIEESWERAEMAGSEAATAED